MCTKPRCEYKGGCALLIYEQLTSCLARSAWMLLFPRGAEDDAAWPADAAGAADVAAAASGAPAGAGVGAGSTGATGLL